jgi:hypothetical protein
MAVLIVLVYRLWIRPRPDKSVSIRTAIFAFGLLALLTPSLITWGLSANQLVKVSQRYELTNLVAVAQASRSLPDSFLNDRAANFWIGREQISIERERKDSDNPEDKIIKANSNPALFAFWIASTWTAAPAMSLRKGSPSCCRRATRFSS